VHLTDPNLGAAEIAAAACVSERQLSRLFAADGGSVPQHILARRLQLAYAILAAPIAPGAAGPPATVAEVAARCGFTSASYFSHAFRRHFGHRASELRHEATSLQEQTMDTFVQRDVQNYPSSG
jgi:AraC-like DNA-binding protein